MSKLNSKRKEIENAVSELLSTAEEKDKILQTSVEALTKWEVLLEITNKIKALLSQHSLKEEYENLLMAKKKLSKVDFSS